MPRQSRLLSLIEILHDGDVHRAADLARILNVTERTIYRDMKTLAASGVPVLGTRGEGYQVAALTTLPPLSLTDSELEALNLALAIIAQATDPDLKAAADRLTDKIDAALPEQVLAQGDLWQFATYPFADAARGFSHIAPLRAAIKARQKLKLEVRKSPQGQFSQQFRPLNLTSQGRVWILTGWSETDHNFRTIRLDLIETVIPQAEFFIDDPGCGYADYLRQVQARAGQRPHHGTATPVQN
jgi:predicted DNA-binding transcriptional regulator YafY